MADRAGELSHAIGGPFPPSLDEQVEASSHQIEIERGNRLLDRLDHEAWRLIQPHLDRMTFAKGQVLEDEGQRSMFLYFPISGAVSFEAGPSRASLQLAMVGREGLIGACLLLGGAALSRAVVQFEGTGWRIAADAIDACIEKSPPLHRQLLLGVHVFLGQLSLTAWANGRSMVENRLASWLLAAADRLEDDRIPVTHRVLSDALGVRRPSVTIAMHRLEQTRAVRIQRGRIHILDRQRLAAVAGGELPHHQAAGRATRNN